MKRKPLRLLLLGFAVGGVLLLAAGVIAFTSSFQTWAGRRFIASQPGMKAEVGRISAGLNRIELKALQFREGGAVLTVPAVVIDVPVVAAGWSKEVLVSRFVAKGWSLDLSKVGQVSDLPYGSSATGLVSANSNVRPVSAAAQAFAGVFAQLALPFDISIDGVDLEGEVILPESRGRVRVTVKGGGLGAAREGKFDLTALGALTGAEVKTLEVRGTVMAAMDTPRTFTRFATRLDAAAIGVAFPAGVKLHADLSAARAATGESYAVAVVTEGQEILGVTAEFSRSAAKLDGMWKLNVRDSDVTPFAFGKPLPVFALTGQGRFDADAGFAGLHAAGRLNVTADRLHLVKPELGAMGELRVSADFDLAGRGGAIAVEKLEVTMAGRRPVATLRALQAFEFRPATRELSATAPARDVFGLVLHGVPVAWLNPFFAPVEVSGGHVRGEFAASPRNGGMTLRSLVPLGVDELSIARPGQKLIERVDLSLSTTIDYTPQGWQAEILDGAVRRDGAALLSLEARAGQLAGKDQPIKATGRLLAQVARWAAQPLAAGSLALTGGEALINFTTSIAAKTELQAAVGVKNLVATGEGEAVKLPALTLDLRADVGADGRIAFSAPLVIERDGRKSDLTATGTIDPEKEKSRGIDAQLSGAQVVVDDALIFGAALTAPRPGSDVAGVTGAAPPWAGLHGSVALRLDQVIWSEAFRVTQVRGRLRLDAGTVKLEGLQAGVGSGGRANAKGALTFNATAPQPYAAQIDVAVKEFDPGPLLRALNGNQPPAVEGKFDAKSTLSAAATRLSLLADHATGEFQVSSRGGVFRGFPVAVNTTAETPGRIASILASAGSVFGGLTGKKDAAEIAGRPEAVAELVRGWNPIPFDQLSVIVTRDETLITSLKNFTLISPELRLAGTGTAVHQPGGRPLDAALTMDFNLRARGRQGELLKYLGVLETQPDDLGYVGCTVPLRVKGTPGRPDAGELNTKLAALALEKGGLADRAAELFNKLRGAGK